MGIYFRDTSFVIKDNFVQKSKLSFWDTCFIIWKTKEAIGGATRDPIVASSFLRPVQLPQMTGGTLGGASAQIQI